MYTENGMKEAVTEKRDGKDKFIVRFSSEQQRAEIKARAALNRRTMNAEVLFLIEKGLEAIRAG